MILCRGVLFGCGPVTSLLVGMSLALAAIAPRVAAANDVAEAVESARVLLRGDHHEIPVGAIERAPGGIRRIVLGPIRKGGVCVKRAYMVEGDAPLSAESLTQAIYFGQVTSSVALSVDQSCELAHFEQVSTIDEAGAVRLYQRFFDAFVSGGSAPRNEAERILVECVEFRRFMGLLGLDRSGAPTHRETRAYFSEALGCDDAARFVRLVFYDPPEGDVVVKVIIAPKGIQVVD